MEFSLERQRIFIHRPMWRKQKFSTGAVEEKNRSNFSTAFFSTFHRPCGKNFEKKRGRDKKGKIKTDSDIDEGFSVLKQFRFWNILYLGNYSVARVIANQCAHWCGNLLVFPDVFRIFHGRKLGLLNSYISCIFSLISESKAAVDVGGDVADVVLGVGIPVFQSDFDLPDGI